MATGPDAAAGPVRLTETGVHDVATLLGAAFQNDPLMVHACPDPDHRARWLPWMFVWPVWWGLLRGEVLTTAGRLKGAAIIVPSDTAGEEDSEVALRARRDRAARERDLSPAEIDTWLRYDAALDAAVQPADHELAKVMPRRHLYLAVLGVGPAHQGRGVGSSLLRAVNARADTDDMPSTLITYQPNNLLLYGRHGYEVVCAGTAPDSGLRWWGMQRQPSQT
jgi:ribosomal protein S18 acetylase RimI-like enzyme